MLNRRFRELYTQQQVQVFTYRGFIFASKLFVYCNAGLFCLNFHNQSKSMNNKNLVMSIIFQTVSLKCSCPNYQQPMSSANTQYFTMNENDRKLLSNQIVIFYAFMIDTIISLRRLIFCLVLLCNTFSEWVSLSLCFFLFFLFLLRHCFGLLWRTW